MRTRRRHLRYTAFVLFIFVLFGLSGCSSPEPKPFYTKEDIVEHCSFKDFNEHNTFFADVRCTEITKAGQGKGVNYYDNMTFYIFDTIEDAESAYKNTKDWFKTDDIRSGQDYRCGWLKNSYDCDVYEYIHISGNLIITEVLEYRSNYFEEGDETSPSTSTKRIDPDAVIDFVEKEFP